MNSIYKNKKKFLLCLSFVSVISLGFFVQSCSNEMDEFEEDYTSINTKYLDLDVTNTTTAFTPEEVKTIAYASLRITMHMVYDSENNVYVFDKNSPADINISERLFDYIYPNMQNIPFTEENWLRIKSDNYQECSTSSGGFAGYQYTQTTCTMTDAQMISHFDSRIAAGNAVSSAAGWTGVGAGIVAPLATGAAGAVATGLGAGLGAAVVMGSSEASQAQAAKSAYMNNSNRTGGTVTTTHTTTTTQTCTLNNTTTQYNYNKK